MSYSPRRVLPGGLQPPETKEIAKRIVSQHPRQVKSNHLSTHFDLTGDCPPTYSAVLGKTTTSGLSEFISSSNSPTKSTTNNHDQSVSQISYAVGGNDHSKDNLNPRKELIYDPQILSRTEIRSKMNTPHIDFRGPQSPNTVHQQELLFERQPVEGAWLTQPRVHSTYGHTERSYRHLNSGFSIHDMEPTNKELLSRSTKKPFSPPTSTAHRIVDGPGDYTRLSHDRKQYNLTSNFSLG